MDGSPSLAEAMASRIALWVASPITLRAYKSGDLVLRDGRYFDKKSVDLDSHFGGDGVEP